MTEKYRTPEEVRNDGLRILTEGLGVVDTLRFISLYSPGSGNYTEERHQWLDQLTPEEILAGIRRRQNEFEQK